MYRTKQDVDKHVRNIFNRIKNEKERNLRGYTIAKLYFMINEHETAKRYLSMFINVREKDAAAHKLLAQIYEKTGFPEKAIQAYKKSLELDESQKDIILKICEMYCILPVDPDRARYWADRAENFFPRNDIVFKLRECIVSGDGDQNNRDLEDLITAELVHRPKDANLRIKLLKLYLDTERSKEAYDHVMQVENQHPFVNDINWYYCLTEVLETYVEDLGKEYTTELFLHLLHAYDRLVFLTLEDCRQHSMSVHRSKHSTCLLDSSAALYSFDQLLFKAEQHPGNGGSWKSILNHYKGQLYFYMGNFLLKRAQKDHGNLKEASRMSAGLFLIAYNFKPIDRHVSWYCHASELKREEMDLLFNRACFRLSQSGHMVRGMCKEDCSKWLTKIRQQVFTSQCREKIFQRILGNRDSLQIASATSHFMTACVFLEFIAEFPDLKSLQEYDKVVSVLYPESLHHHVWLALQYYSLKQKVQPDYGFQLFKSLQPETNNLLAATAESLSVHDVEAFLYATVRTAALALEECHSSNLNVYDVALFQPVMISSSLCTDEQSRWWFTAHQLYKNIAIENLAELRRVLQHGIEVIRALGNHGLDTCMVVHLAETFADRASEMKLQTENEMWQVLEKRAAHYWKIAIPMLEKMANSQTLRNPKTRLFESKSPDPSLREIKKWIEDGHFYLACQAMNVNQHEEAIEAFGSLKSPYASYYQAVIFKKLAEEECNQPREQITSEMRSKHIILLTRARDALYATLDRLHGDRKHPLNQVLSNEIEDVETKLARIDPDMSQRHDFDALSDECLSSQDSDERNNSLESTHHHFSSHHTFRKNSGISHRNIVNNTVHGHTSSGRDSADMPTSRHREEHIRPSPERLDAQMRSLAFSHDAVIKTIMEQNKALIESHRSIVQALQQNKMAVEEVKSQLEELQKQIGKCAMMQRRHRRRVKTPCAQSHENCEEANAKGEDIEEPSNEDYYEGYYYDEAGDEVPDYDDAGDEQGIVYSEFPMNSPYKYCNRSLQNEYPYGNITGLQGTATVTYAPPSASRNAAHPSGCYPSYYQHRPSMACPVNTSTPVQPRPVHSQPLGPGYFGPSGPVSASLQFSEGQKLPQFNFSPGMPPQNSFLSATHADNQSAIPCLGSLQNYNQQLAGHVPFSTTEELDEFKQSVLSTACSPSCVGNAAVMNPVSVYTVPSSPAHAFQIPMPSHASTFATPVQQGSTKENLSPVALTTPDPKSAVTETLYKQSSVKDYSHTINKSATSESGSYKNDDDNYSGPDFKPVIPLPDEVEVKTGEEDEKVSFQERAKLFRFVDKEWKERGVGYVKILWHEKMKHVRILMRRDQILKICANHYIHPDMTLTPMKNSDTAWIWAAQDFADEQVRAEQFCIRFKTAEIANAFRQEFEKAQTLLSKTQIQQEEAVPETKNETASKAGVVGFGDKFKPKLDSWNCPTCMINNDAQQNACVACATAKPGSCVATNVGFSQPIIAASVVPITTGSIGLVTQPKLAFAIGDSSSSQPSGFKLNTENRPDASIGVCTFGNQQLSAIENVTTASHLTMFTAPANSLQTSTTASSQPAFVFGNKNVSSVPKQAGFVFGASSLEKENATVPDLGPASSLLNAMANKHSDHTSSNQDATSPSTHNYGGFTFSGLPTIKQPSPSDVSSKKNIKPITVKSKDKVEESKEDKSATNAKPNPFSGFSFGSSKQNTLLPIEDEANESVFLNLAIEAPTFSSLAPDEAAFKSDPAFAGFSGAGESVFRPQRKNSSSSNQNDDFESSAEFKPIVPLPEIVDTKTGEEEEEKLFGARAKLFRLDNQTNEWKERGIGEIKLLRHKTTNRYRVLMRREQVFKICANHYITGYMELKPKLTSKCAWMWSANDFADGELKREILTVKFKMPEIAEAFSKTFQKCVENTRIADSNSTGDSLVPTVGQLPEWECPTCNFLNKAGASQCSSCVGNSTTNNAIPLSKLFKSKPGSWTCSTCCVSNDADKQSCIACDSEKPGIDKCSATKSAISNTVPLSELFKSKPGSWTCSTCCVSNDAEKETCVACDSEKPGIDKCSAAKSAISNTTPLSELFKSKPGNWTCSVCCLQMDADKVACVACETPKPGAKVEEKPKFFGWNTQTSPAFKFPMPSSSDLAKDVCNSSLSTTTTTDTGLVNSPLSVSATAAAALEDAKSAEVVSAVTCENSESNLSPVSIAEFRFGSPQKFVFSFSGVQPKSPLNISKPQLLDQSKDSDTADDDNVIETENEIAFQPVIPLPEKIEVKTGEEDEDILYCHRAKLFRWVDSEWKERGIGDVKILHHRSTGKIRLLMRRDQVLKICLNHCLTPDMKFLVQDQKSWVWASKDFSDNEAREERFAIRFKDEEIAKNFMKAIDNAKNMLSGCANEVVVDVSSTELPPSSNSNSSATVTASSSPNDSKSYISPSQFSFKLDSISSNTPTSFSFGNKFGTHVSSTKTCLFGAVSPPKSSVDLTSPVDCVTKQEDDLNVIYENKKPLQEKIEKACSLSLPSNFYLYEDAPKCPGCRGCTDDSASSEVEIVYERIATPEQVARAAKLMLPPNFYLYETAPPCPGCRGCREIDSAVDTKPQSTVGLNVDESSLKNQVESFGFGSSSSSSLDFASLAKESSSSTAFQNSKPAFSFNQVGVPVFPSSNDGHDEGSEGPDPHFEPIVSLPQLVEVKTGEEDEIKLYGQRAKLYRFDSAKKEWKERGVGELKLLQHINTGRIRILLRREQVHKIACNHHITQDMHLEPLATSECAWMWFAMDFAEEKCQLEKFAIKFKTIQLAQEFKKTFEEYQLKCCSSQEVATNELASAPMSPQKAAKELLEVQNISKKESPATKDASEHSKSPGGESSEEDDDDDEDEESVMFEKRVTLAIADENNIYQVAGVGNLRVLYDDDVYGARIQVVTDNGKLVANHLIAMQTDLQVSGSQCFWSALDFSEESKAVRLSFQASFGSKAAAGEFESIFTEGKDYAKHSEILERSGDAAENYSDSGTESVKSLEWDYDDLGPFTTYLNCSLSWPEPQLMHIEQQVISPSRKFKSINVASKCAKQHLIEGLQNLISARFTTPSRVSLFQNLTFVSCHMENSANEVELLDKPWNLMVSVLEQQETVDELIIKLRKPMLLKSGAYRISVKDDDNDGCVILLINCKPSESNESKGELGLLNPHLKYSNMCFSEEHLPVYDVFRCSLQRNDTGYRTADESTNDGFLTQSNSTCASTSSLLRTISEMTEPPGVLKDRRMHSVADSTSFGGSINYEPSECPIKKCRQWLLINDRSGDYTFGSIQDSASEVLSCGPEDLLMGNSYLCTKCRQPMLNDECCQEIHDDGDQPTCEEMVHEECAIVDECNERQLESNVYPSCSGSFEVQCLEENVDVCNERHEDTCECDREEQQHVVISEGVPECTTEAPLALGKFNSCDSCWGQLDAPAEMIFEELLESTLPGIFKVSTNEVVECNNGDEEDEKLAELCASNLPRTGSLPVSKHSKAIKLFKPKSCMFAGNDHRMPEELVSRMTDDVVVYDKEEPFKCLNLKVQRGGIWNIFEEVNSNKRPRSADEPCQENLQYGLNTRSDSSDANFSYEKAMNKSQRRCHIACQCRMPKVKKVSIAVQAEPEDETSSCVSSCSSVSSCTCSEEMNPDENEVAETTKPSQTSKPCALSRLPFMLIYGSSSGETAAKRNSQQSPCELKAEDVPKQEEPQSISSEYLTGEEGNEATDDDCFLQMLLQLYCELEESGLSAAAASGSDHSTNSHECTCQAEELRGKRAGMECNSSRMGLDRIHLKTASTFRSLKPAITNTRQGWEIGDPERNRKSSPIGLMENGIGQRCRATLNSSSWQGLHLLLESLSVTSGQNKFESHCSIQRPKYQYFRLEDGCCDFLPNDSESNISSVIDTTYSRTRESKFYQVSKHARDGYFATRRSKKHFSTIQ